MLKSLKDDLSNTLPKEAIEGLEKNDTTAAAISGMEIVKAVGVIWFVYVFTDHKYTDSCLDGQKKFFITFILCFLLMSEASTNPLKIKLMLLK